MRHLPLRPLPILLASSLLLAACASQPRTAVDAPPVHGANAPTSWLADVTAISAHADSTARRASIRSLLSDAGLAASETSFTANELQGTNLLAPVSGNAVQPLLLLGAHLDQVSVGDGVTDNASGSSVVLALARRFREEPLQHHRVSVAFWDLEEKGLLGANAYVTDGGEKPALYVNFDVFGWGDTLWMMTPDPAHPLVATSQSATHGVGIGLSSGDKYPPTDHLPFLKAGWPAVSYSLVGKDEIAPILEVFGGGKPAAMPKVMTVIHSARDTLAEINADQVETGIDAVEAALREWDAKHGD